MKVYQTNEIKNIALLGNDGSGKTTLTEALLWSMVTLYSLPFIMWSGMVKN